MPPADAAGRGEERGSGGRKPRKAVLSARTRPAPQSTWGVSAGHARGHRPAPRSMWGVRAGHMRGHRPAPRSPWRVSTGHARGHSRRRAGCSSPSSAETLRPAVPGVSARGFCRHRGRTGRPQPPPLLWFPLLLSLMGLGGAINSELSPPPPAPLSHGEPGFGGGDSCQAEGTNAGCPA